MINLVTLNGNFGVEIEEMDHIALWRKASSIVNKDIEYLGDLCDVVKAAWVDPDGFGFDDTTYNSVLKPLNAFVSALDNRKKINDAVGYHLLAEMVRDRISKNYDMFINDALRIKRLYFDDVDYITFVV